ncbi:MAG: macro domain-containing protein [Clostridia bacterium]|nr:macro domain-containing protein [Clostridia bacterium]
MPFLLREGDITKYEADAIVNAAAPSLLGGGGVDGCIHRAAGPGLLAECRTLGGCATGDAKATGAYRLPARFVIHTVGPVWQGGGAGERELLLSCYRRSLEEAEKRGCGSVSFPLISSGAYGYPKKEAFAAAKEAILDFLSHSEMTVTLFFYRREDFVPETEEEGLLFPAETKKTELFRKLVRPQKNKAFPDPAPSLRLGGACREEAPLAAALCCDAARDPDLEHALGTLDESFSEMLLRKIDEKGMTDAACYKKANVDRKLFSKIRSNKNYRTSKQTALAFAVALELPLPEVRELLGKAGFALSRSSRFDVIVTYFLERGVYDIHRINEALFSFDQTLLGA